MAELDENWLIAFEAALWLHFYLDRQDAGVCDEVALRYADLPPREAAFAYADGYDIQRVDVDWLTVSGVCRSRR